MRVPIRCQIPAGSVILASLVSGLVATSARAQGFDAVQTLWGPGRLSSGDHFRSVLDPLKAGPFTWMGKGWSLALGGQYSVRFESHSDLPGNASGGSQDSFASHRIRVTLRASVADRVGFYIEVQDARVWGSEGVLYAPVPFVGAHQAFVDLRVRRWFQLRVGRMELVYGAERLLGNLDWNQAGQAFDGILLRFAWTPITLDAFATIVRARVDLGDLLHNEGAQLYGLYARMRRSRSWGIDVYSLGLVHDLAQLQSPTREEAVLTVGSRFIAGNPWFSLDAELIYQLNAGSHEGAAALQLEVELPTPVRLYLGSAYRWASEGFNQLFPNYHDHLGYADLVRWQNLHALRFRLGIRPRWLHFWVDVHHFWSQRPFEAMGWEIDVSLTVPVHQMLSLSAGWAGVFPTDATQRVHWGHVGLRTQF